jgi:hypothetical protein
MKTSLTRVFFKYEESGEIKAIMKNAENDEPIAERMVKPRHGDKPNKVIGRAYAFKKLMTHSLENV